MRHHLMMTAAVALTMLVGAAAPAETVEIGADRDNTLYENAQGDLSNGAGEHVFAGRTNQPAGEHLRRALIRFDVAAAGIPSGSTIDSVTLTLRMSRTQADDEVVSLHRVLSDWGEGTSGAGGQEGSGAPATAGDATWIHTFYSSSLWGDPGGDFDGGASAGQTIGGNGFYTWGSTDDMVADVQGWLDTPSSNHGWILIGNESVQKTAKRFDSRQNGTVSRRPKLTIDYTLPADSGACCFDNGSCSVLTQTECMGQGGDYQGNGTGCDPNECPQPTGACCSGEDCQELTASACATQGGAYQGDGTDCSPNPCLLPTGACCFLDGDCLELSATACGGQGGVYQGDETGCVPNQCPQPTGACCFSGAICEGQTADDCASAGGTYQGDFTTCLPNPCPLALEPFVDALPIPGVLDPVVGEPGGEALYDVAMTQFTQQLHRDLSPTTVWGYAGGTPGPIIEATTGLPVTVRWINDLRDEQGALRTSHYLPVDNCPHGADTDDPSTVVHLHGGHVPARVDGYPEDTFLPGSEATYCYPNLQPPATLWFHDHALGITRLNVYMGLAGIYLLRDQFELDLGLPAGDFEIPLVLQDRRFNLDGTLQYPEAWQDHFAGDTVLVNGKVWPFLNVKQGLYRFRILNGSNSRTYTLSLSDGATFHQIGTDGGLLPAPVALTTLTISSGERADVVMDFSSYAPETEILLVNSAPDPFPGEPGVGVVPDVIKFVVQDGAGFPGPLPEALRPVEPLDENDAVEFRDFELRKSAEACAGSHWLINDLLWDDITELPERGTTEVWSFINRSGTVHPMHMHLVFFQILDRQAFEVVGDEIVPVGSPIPPDPNELGWKDTVRANPQQITRVIARFEDFTGLYAYHCHILEHEDHEMMRQFEVVDPCPLDIDDSGDVGFADLLEVLSTWGPCCACPGDLNEDGMVGFDDLLLVLSNWGPCP